MVFYYLGNLFSGAHFQKRRSYYFTETVHSKIENIEFVSAALLELSKTSYSTKHDVLYQKLFSFGFKGAVSN